MLRDIIFSSQRRNNQGVLQHPIRNFRREPVYQEILQYSYQDYFEKFAIPYYSARPSPREIGGAEVAPWNTRPVARGGRRGYSTGQGSGKVISRGEPAAETLEKAGDLRTYDAGLRANPDIRVIVNQNDFLLTDEDLAWLHATFAPEQLTVFPQGGHLGNLSNPTVQKSILAALTPMKPPNPNRNDPPYEVRRVIPHRNVPTHCVKSSRKRYKLNMKKILFLTGIISLLTTTGCIFPQGGRHDEHARYEHHDAVIVGPPVVEVRAPEVVVRPPEVIVR